MKRIVTSPALLLISCLLCFAQCKKDKAKTPLEQLPPETQTGANTFGCLVNGQVFKPGGAQLSGGSLQANYQDLGNGTGGGRYLTIISRKKSDGLLKSVGLFTDSVPIRAFSSYSLVKRVKGNASGDYFNSLSASEFELFQTNNIYSGQLFIKRLDSISQIISGTFSFKAVSSRGDTINITDGRFDLRYTR